MIYALLFAIAFVALYRITKKNVTKAALFDTRFNTLLLSIIFVFIIEPLRRLYTKFVQKGVSAPIAGDTQISAEFVTQCLRKNKVIGEKVTVVEAVLEDLKGNRGLAAAINVVKLTYNKPTENAPKSLILKRAGNVTSAKENYSTVFSGQSRESEFYNSIGKAYSFIPKIYYASGSTMFGPYTVLMEDLQPNSTGVNFFFGNQIWGMKPLSNPKDPVEILRKMYSACAEIHSAYWNDKSLFQINWLKGSDWYRGRGKARWIAAIETGRNCWEKLKKTMNTNPVKFSPKLIQIIDKSFENTSWDNFQATIHKSGVPFTLTHGDFHAANMMLQTIGNQDSLKIVDWSEVGICEPALDLGQTMISDVKPEIWRKNDKQLVREYWEILTSSGKISRAKYTYEQCYNDYSRSGVEKWIWSFGVLGVIGLPANAVQYFHDQLLTFIEDHGDHPYYQLKPVVCLDWWLRPL